MAGEDGDGGSSKKLLEGKGKGKDPASPSGESIERESQNPTLLASFSSFSCPWIYFKSCSFFTAKVTEEKPDEDDAPPTVEDGLGKNVVAEEKPGTDLEKKGKLVFTTLQVTKEVVIILAMVLPAIKVGGF
jgi:hypothetical protein